MRNEKEETFSLEKQTEMEQLRLGQDELATNFPGFCPFPPPSHPHLRGRDQQEQRSK